MYDENDGFYTTKEQKESHKLKDIVGKLEGLLEDIKNEAGSSERKKELSKAIRKNIEKATEALKRAKMQTKVGVDKTTEALKQAKEKYESIEPAKQKMIIAALTASLVTAIGMALCFTKKDDK